MMRFAVVLAVLCLVSAVPASSQYGGLGPGVVDAANGDPFWQPTDKQLQGWASDGINVARRDAPILTAPGVHDWTWIDSKGIPCSGGSSLVATVALVPPCATTAAGYWSSWDEATWNRIEIGQDAVALDIAQNVRYDLFGTQVQFVFGLVGEGDEEGNPEGAVWYGGEWRPLEIYGGCPASDLIDGPQRGVRGWSWIGSYLLALSVRQEGSLDLDKVWVVEGSMPLHPRTGPDEAFVSAIPAPRGGLRVAIGQPEQFAFVDF
jgi:hypothetical protein